MIEIESGRAGRPGLATLEKSDGELLTRFFYRLSFESVYRRFLSPISKPDQFRASLLAIDHHDREAIAAVQGGEVVGVVQYSRPSGKAEADLAIVVADGWQHQGLGTRLIAALTERALAEGVTAFAIDIQGDNYGALRLLKRVAPNVRMKFSQGVGEGLIPLPAVERL